MQIVAWSFIVSPAVIAGIGSVVFALLMVEPSRNVGEGLSYSAKTAAVQK